MPEPREKTVGNRRLIAAVGETGACPACGGALERWRSVPAGEPSDQRTFDLLRCRNCQSAVTAGDSPGAEAYGSGVYDPAPPRGAALIAALQRLVGRQPVRLLRRAGLPPGARVLDAGAGRGRLVEALRRAGYEATGIDPSGRGSDVERTTIDEHNDSDLDAVVLWHVLEHLDDPRPSLRRVAGWLKPGGVVLVGAPNAASLQARIAGEKWLHWDAPRHRVHLTARGVQALFADAGLQSERTAHLVWEHNPAGMWMAMLSSAGMTPGFPFHLLKRNVPARPKDLALLVVGAPLAPVALAAEAAAAGAKRGGTIAALARKPR